MGPPLVPSDVFAPVTRLIWLGPEMVAVNEFGRPVPIAQPTMTDPIQKEAAS